MPISDSIKDAIKRDDVSRLQELIGQHDAINQTDIVAQADQKSGQEESLGLLLKLSIKNKSNRCVYYLLQQSNWNPMFKLDLNALKNYYYELHNLKNLEFIAQPLFPKLRDYRNPIDREVSCKDKLRAQPLFFCAVLGFSEIFEYLCMQRTLDIHARMKKMGDPLERLFQQRTHFASRANRQSLRVAVRGENYRRSLEGLSIREFIVHMNKINEEYRILLSSELKNLAEEETRVQQEARIQRRRFEDPDLTREVFRLDLITFQQFTDANIRMMQALDKRQKLNAKDLAVELVLGLHNFHLPNDVLINVVSSLLDLRDTKASAETIAADALNSVTNIREKLLVANGSKPGKLNWGRVAVTVAFVRANLGNPFQRSILGLLNHIGELTGNNKLYSVPEHRPSGNLLRFSRQAPAVNTKEAGQGQGLAVSRKI